MIILVRRAIRYRILQSSKNVTAECEQDGVALGDMADNPKPEDYVVNYNCKADIGEELGEIDLGDLEVIPDFNSVSYTQLYDEVGKRADYIPPNKEIGNIADLTDNDYLDWVDGDLRNLYSIEK